jgi:uncharacterized membrane protein
MNISSITKEKILFSQSSLFAILLGLTLVLGAFLRFYGLGAEGYWLDEIVMLHDLMSDIKVVIDLTQPPVYMIPAQLWVRVFGEAEISTRAFSAIIGIACIGLTYLVGRELLGPWTGLMGAFLCAVSEFQIDYSQLARFYITYEFMALLSFLFYVRAVKSNKIKAFLFYTVVTVLLIYSHIFGVFLVAAQIIYLFYWSIKNKNFHLKWLISEALISISAIPYLNLFISGEKELSKTAMSWLPLPPLWFPLRTLYTYVLPLRHQRSWAALGASFLGGLAVLLIGAFCFAINQGKTTWFSRFQELFDRDSLLVRSFDELVLLLFWLLFPIFFPMVLSYILGPMYSHRYAIGSAPALYLLLGAGVIAVRNIIPRIVVIASLLIVIIPGLQHYYVTDLKEQWPEIASYVELYEQENDVVIFAPSEMGWISECFYWYYRGNIPSCDIEYGIESASDIKEILSGCVSGYDRFWLVMRGDAERIQAFSDFFLNSKPMDMRLKDEKHFQLVKLYLFEFYPE